MPNWWREEVGRAVLCTPRLAHHPGPARRGRPALPAMTEALGEDRIVVLISRRATAEQPQRLAAGVPELVLLAWKNCYRVAGIDLTHFPFDADSPPAMGNLINLLGLGVEVFLRAASHGHTRLGQALIANR